MKSLRPISIVLSAILLFLAFVAISRGGALGVTASQEIPSSPVGSAFTYQGRLTDGGVPANGAYDFEFSLFDDATGGALLGINLIEDVSVSAGNFTVSLDFTPAPFNGGARWLRIGVRPGSSQAAFTYLDQRQQITPAPYAVYALASSWPGIENMPAGFADGIDDNTIYSAGFGLDLSGSQFNVITDTVQARVDSNCTPGSAIRAINADGTVVCEQAGGSSIPLFTRTPIDVAGTTGLHPSLAIGSDGLPIIAYKDNTNNLLKVAHCDNVNCTSATIAPLGIGSYPSIIIGADDLPLLLYVGADSLTAGHCNNNTCTDVTITQLYISGTNPQLVLGSDGLGLVSFVNFSTNTPSIGHCNDVSCSNLTTNALDTGSISNAASLIVGVDGFGLVAYDDSTDGYLKVAHCEDVTCSSNTIATVDSGSQVISNLSIMKSSDGHGLIAYMDFSFSPRTVRLAYCQDVACTTYEFGQIGNDGNSWIESTTAPDQMGAFTYFAPTGLKVVHCLTVNCSQFTLFVLDENDAYSVSGAVIRFGADGLPVVAYMSKTFDLMVTHCDDIYCAR